LDGPDVEATQRPEVTVGIPAYNERECLEAVVRNAREVLARLVGSYEVLIVDDGSTDGTSALADALCARWPEVRVVHHPENLSFSGAIRTLYRNVRGQWLFLCPADGQVDVAEIEPFLARRDVADVVLGYRLTRPDRWYRRINSLLFKLITRMLFGFRFREISNCKLYRSDLLRDLPLISRPGTATIEPEVIFRLARKGARFAEVPYTLLARQGGTAKGAKMSMILKTFFNLFWLRFRLLGRDPMIPAASDKGTVV
jgi:glycosyltransferase involved in cell wall biosynthesis